MKNVDDTHAAIIDAALAVLERDGPEALSVRRVARQADLSPGTVTYYFRNRTSLVEAVLEIHHARLERILMSLIERIGHTDPPLAVGHALAEVYDLMRDHVQLTRLALITNSVGGIPDRRRGPVARAGAALAPLLALPTEDATLLVQTMSFCVARYACMPIAELRELLDLEGDQDDSVVHQRVTTHLTTLVANALPDRLQR